MIALEWKEICQGKIGATIGGFDCFIEQDGNGIIWTVTVGTMIVGMGSHLDQFSAKFAVRLWLSTVLKAAQEIKT